MHSRALATVVTTTLLATSALAAEHPRVLISREDVAKLRAKAQNEPYKTMKVNIQKEAAEPDGSGKSILYSNKVINLAALYTLTGDKAHAADAEKIVIEMVNDKQFWNTPGSKGLTRAAGALRASIAYDLCADAWPPQTRQLVSAKLRYAADNIMKSMGQGANTGLANNWQAVRYGSAGLAFLASDEPGGEAGAKQAYDKLKQHLNANLGDNGWNPEGIGYTQYPWQFTGPFGIAAHRAGIGDLRKDVRKSGLTFWHTFVGTVNLPRPGGLGLRADLSDDHPVWSGDGTAGMAFWYAPQEQQPGIKWMYDYLVGAGGDKSFDASATGGLYSVLYYPDKLAPVNPAEVPSLGLTYTDKSHGIAIFRNRFKDSDDIVVLANAHARQPQGCHGGPDTNTFRLMGLGAPWAVGSGRTGDAGGQTNLFVGQPPKKAPGGLGKLEAVHFTKDGGGYAVTTGSCMGVNNHTRTLAVDYSGKSGAAAVIVTTDTSDNGNLFRWNTPEFNTIKQSKDGFTLTAPNGATCKVTVIAPAVPVFATGTFERGGGAGHTG